MNDMLKTTPDLSIAAATGLLFEHYGLSGTLSPLASERDQNQHGAQSFFAPSSRIRHIHNFPVKYLELF